MRFGYHETCLDHDPGKRHPESPERLRAIKRELTGQHNARFEEAPPASRQAVQEVHKSGYLDQLQAFIANGGGAWDPDTVVGSGSWEAALASAGLSIWAAQVAQTAEQRRSLPFALGRPPGHHAFSDNATGFCLLNNVAIAAEGILSSESIERVGILDWDVHHGNGTQDIFYNRSDVGFVSIHQADLYPGTGTLEELGTGPGDGTTLNIPLEAGAGTESYLAVLDELIDPWFRRFDPDLLLASVGFDAHKVDPISQMGLTTEGYGLLTERSLALADTLDIGVGFVLEGGYDLEVLADGVAMVHMVCEGYQPVEPDGRLRPEDQTLIDRARTLHGIGS